MISSKDSEANFKLSSIGNEYVEYYGLHELDDLLLKE